MLILSRPAADLAAAVDCGVAIRRTGHEGPTRFPAMLRAMLTLDAAAPAGAPVLFHAPSTRPMVHPSAGPVHAVGLVLQPVTAARLAGPSIGAGVNLALPWAELAGAAESVRLGDALAQAADDGQRLQALQDSLRRVLARGPERVGRARAEQLQLLCQAVGQDGARATRTLGLGERRLERRCRALLGLAPKQLQRLTRLQAVLEAALRNGHPPDAQGALAAGYYDQSHLAREVRELAGAPLRDLLAGARADGEWWPLVAQPWRMEPLRHHR